MTEITATEKRTAMISKADGTVHAARNYKTKCTNRTNGFSIQYTDAPLTCADCIAIEGQAAVQRETKAAAAANGVELPNMFRTRSLTHELVYLADGTPAPKCRARATQGEAFNGSTRAISCNSCSGAHRSGTHLG